MAKRDRERTYSRKEAVRDQAEVEELSPTLLSFSFKHLDETQPKDAPQTLALWHEQGLLSVLICRLKELSQLSRDEAIKQQQVKVYVDFPQKKDTDFFHPEHVTKNVSWGVLKSIGGQKGTVAGYIVDSVFYVVFLDMNHRFWITLKKHT